MKYGSNAHTFYCWQRQWWLFCSCSCSRYHYCGWSWKDIEHIFNNAHNRITSKTQAKQRPYQGQPLIIHAKYHPRSLQRSDLNNIFKTTLGTHVPNQTIISLSRPKNLGNRLVRSKLPNVPNMNPSDYLNPWKKMRKEKRANLKNNTHPLFYHCFSNIKLVIFVTNFVMIVTFLLYKKLHPKALYHNDHTWTLFELFNKTPGPEFFENSNSNLFWTTIIFFELLSPSHKPSSLLSFIFKHLF